MSKDKSEEELFQEVLDAVKESIDNYINKGILPVKEDLLSIFQMFDASIDYIIQNMNKEDYSQFIYDRLFDQGKLN